MDEFKSETDILKLCLSDIKMHTLQVRGGSYQTYTIINFALKKYYQLKYNTDYSGEVLHDECELKFAFKRKKRGTTVVVIIEKGFTKCHKLVAAYVSYGNDTLSSTVYPEQFAKDEYDVNIDSSIIYDKRNEPLKSGQLHLAFQFEFRLTFERRVFPFTGLAPKKESARTFRPQIKNRFESEEDVLSKNLKEAFQESKFGDFIILLEPNTRFHVHKAILAARSEFLAKCVSSTNKGLKLSHTNPGAINLVLEFLYSGKMLAKTLDELIDVSALSVNLKITSLLKLCIRNLENRICLFTADKIEAAAEVLSLDSLARAVQNYRRETTNVTEFLFLDPEHAF